MLSLIYPYRNRSLKHVKRSLESLESQSINDFKVYFVDYGSFPEFSKKISRLVSSYQFATYIYYPTQYQPWNKSKALNSVIRNLETGYCFIADVDMIFQPDFVKKAIVLQQENTAAYFKVGYLDKEETSETKDFEDYKVKQTSGADATGLTIFPVKQLKALHGFDEFYHLWGAEDTDMHVRFTNNGGKVIFYDKELLLLHQWHHSYMRRETGDLTENLQVRGIIQLNHEHLQFAREQQTTMVNEEVWGEPLSPKAYEELESFTGRPKVISNKQKEIMHLLFYELPQSDNNKIASFIIKMDPFQASIKYKTKKLLRKKVPSYYSLKEINDMLLLHIISFYRNYPYIYKIDDSRTSIHLIIKKQIE